MDSSNVSSADLQNQELETKIQELYTASRKIELLQANVEHLEHENECLKKSFEEGNVLLEEARKSDAKSKNDEILRQNIADLKHELQESQETEKTVREENVRLEKRLQQVLETYATNIPGPDEDLDAEEIISLNAQLSQVRDEKTNLQAELLAVSVNLQHQADEKTRLRQEVLEKEEELECMESQFSTQCDISERLREENQQLKEQLESEKGQVNVTRKGNSLFSEVDDRRVAAESKVVQIHEQMKSLEEMVTREQKENKRLRTQLMHLRQNSKRGFDAEAVTGLQAQLLQAKKTIADLTEKLAKLEITPKPSPVTQFRKSSSAHVSDDDKSYINFLEGLIRTKTKEMSELKLQAHASRQQCVRTDLDLTRANSEVQLLRHEVSQLKHLNSDLSLTLQDVKHKYGEDSPEMWSPDRRAKRNIGTNISTAPRPVISASENKTVSETKENSNSDSDSKAGLIPQDSKQNVRLRDLINLPGNATGLDRSYCKGKPGKSVGVQLSQDVKVVTADGNQSRVELKGDGNAGKLKRSQGKGTVKSVSVDYPDLASVEPPECKQQ